MEDKTEKKLRELLPYIITTGVLFLILPLLMGSKTSAVTYVVQLGAFPLTALGCGFHYAYRKQKKDLALCFLAPLFYALTALLYGMWRASWITVLIYIVAYFICGYLGMMLYDLVKPKTSGKSKRSHPAVPSPSRRAQRPRRVNVQEHQEQPEREFKAEDPDTDISLDVSTTDDEIEAILNSIHNRKSQ